MKNTKQNNERTISLNAFCERVAGLRDKVKDQRIAWTSGQPKLAKPRGFAKGETAEYFRLWSVDGSVREPTPGNGMDIAGEFDTAEDATDHAAKHRIIGHVATVRQTWDWQWKDYGNGLWGWEVVTGEPDEVDSFDL